ncbi:hypothetical protein EVC45_02425 [Paraburkholderia sp. UYCP14C]|uniref:hypothetical protein n=1 Tax=Paraburkholderia sp. UYCP14C TaxID=2511130 RepID=UPI00101E9D16|nr:hypothetical protein [Paraburkholderia sp. UYCP14C]RZF31328.1 hypothetical protein EVC45_02425 [Paraburkholderia sp. UYCP14C]
MNHAIYIKGNDDFTLQPQDAATKGIVNHLISASDRRLYACVRAFGYSALEAAIAAFGNVISGHVDALGEFATAYETTRGFERDYRQVCEQIGEQRLKIEWAKRCEELSVAARDAAMSLRVALAGYKPEVYAVDTSGDEAAWAALVEQREKEQRADRRAENWDRPQQPESYSNTTLFGHIYQ